MCFTDDCVSGSPAPSVTWWKDGSVFDDTYELVEKQNNGANNSTVIVDGIGVDGDGVDSDETYKLVEKQNNAANNITVILDGDHGGVTYIHCDMTAH